MLQKFFLTGAADVGSLFCPEEKDDPGVFRFVNKRGVFQIDDERTVSLDEDLLWQGFLQAIKRDRKRNSVVSQMDDGFFLFTFDEKDLLTGNVVDAFWCADAKIAGSGFAWLYAARVKVLQLLFYFIIVIGNEDRKHGGLLFG